MNFFGFLNNGLKSRGFTLLEILVSMVIIITLTVMVLSNFEFSGSQFALKRSVYKLSQDIRNTQEMAISSREVEGVSPKGGCGIHFDLLESKTSYILFADILPDGLYNPADGDLIIGNSIELEKNVEISNIFWGGSLDVLDIVFVPPDPKIKINGSEAIIATRVDINLIVPTGATGTVSVNSVGLIETK